MRDRRWIEQQIHQSLVATYTRIEELVAQVNKDHGFQIAIGSGGYQSCVMRAGYVSLGVSW